MISSPCRRLAPLCVGLCLLAIAHVLPAQEIRTPLLASPRPHINGPDVFGVRPDHPFFYQIPATGVRPMIFYAANLPKGLKLNPATGLISGSVYKHWFKHKYVITLYAKNEHGLDAKNFTIVVGETIALTPPMGWNSWNAYHETVDGENVISAARAMASSGMINYGWTYINIDDSWQGERGGKYGGIQPNDKFANMEGMCDEIHGLGLKVGIYSTPWETSYARFIGGSSDDSNGAWTHKLATRGKYCFADNDAKQWAAWGIDYLKYDWNPRSTRPKAETSEQFLDDSLTMHTALRKSGRDVVFSYSNDMPFNRIAAQSRIYDCWRTTGDISDNWISMVERAFYFPPHNPRNPWHTTLQGAPSDKWAQYASPGHWNDPDMMVLGVVNFGGKQHPTRLTPEEQYVHMTAWCMASAPLLLGCDLDKLDAFTLNLVENTEVLAIDQDSLGRQATIPSNVDNVLLVYKKELEDGSTAVALYNLSDKPSNITANWKDLGISGNREVRDLWRQKNLGKFEDKFTMPVAPHSAELFKLLR